MSVPAGKASSSCDGDLRRRVVQLPVVGRAARHRQQRLRDHFSALAGRRRELARLREQLARALALLPVLRSQLRAVDEQAGIAIAPAAPSAVDAAERRRARAPAARAAPRRSGAAPARHQARVRWRALRCRHCRAAHPSARRGRRACSAPPNAPSSRCSSVRTEHARSPGLARGGARLVDAAGRLQGEGVAGMAGARSAAAACGNKRSTSAGDEVAGRPRVRRCGASPSRPASRDGGSGRRRRRRRAGCRSAAGCSSARSLRRRRTTRSPPGAACSRAAPEAAVSGVASGVATPLCSATGTIVAGVWRLDGATAETADSEHGERDRFLMHAGQDDAPLLIRP